MDFFFPLSFVTEGDGDDDDQPLQTAKPDVFIEFSTDLQKNFVLALSPLQLLSLILWKCKSYKCFWNTMIFPCLVRIIHPL